MRAAGVNALAACFAKGEMFMVALAVRTFRRDHPFMCAVCMCNYMPGFWTS